MIRRILLFSILLVLASTSVYAQFNSINYQGVLTDEADKPLPDGSYPLVLKLYTAETGGTPSWTSPTINVTTKKGLFSTKFSPPSSLALNNSSLWLEATIDGQTLSPRQKLDATMYAVRALSADTVPDGSVTLSKLGNDVQFDRAPYLQGIKSGLDDSCRLKIYIDDELVETATLGAPYTDTMVCSRAYTEPEPWPVVSPAMITHGELILRRQVTSNNDWYRYYLDAIVNTPEGPISLHSVRIVLLKDGTESVSWDFPVCLVLRHNYRLADDGLPVEELTFRVYSGFFKSVPEEQECRPVGLGLQLGFTSGLPDTQNYDVLIDGKPFPDVVMVSDLELSMETEEPRPREYYVKRVPADFVLRQTPLARSPLSRWYQEVCTGFDPATTPKPVELRIGETTIRVCESAFPCGYTLKIGDDGLPYEEYTITYSKPASL